ncbi:MAG TPA: ABC transporter permease [Streptosporangiaceae bacterium]|jgi:NitT/TauT family transport system permease protein
MTTFQDDQLAPPAADPAATRRGPSAGRRVLLRLIPPLVLLIIAVGVWQFVCYVALDPTRRFLLPPLQTVIDQSFFQSANFTTLLEAFWTTAYLALIGLAIAIALGVSIAVFMHQSRFLERSLYPYLILFQTVPILALVPLIGFWLGFSSTSRIVVCVIIALFPIIANTSFGLQSATAAQNDLFRLHHAGRLRMLKSLYMPASLPAMFAGFRISAGLSVVGEIVGGFFFQKGPSDLGILINTCVDQLNTELLFGAVFASAVLGVLVFWLFTGLGRLVYGNWKE